MFSKQNILYYTEMYFEKLELLIETLVTKHIIIVCAEIWNLENCEFFVYWRIIYMKNSIKDNAITGKINESKIS